MPSPLRGAYVSRGPEKTRVLVVEDESDIAGLVKHTLERSGDAVVDIASSGDQALKLASEQTPDLIILDLNLPVLGGLEVCRLLRTRPTTAKTPIIMLTARTTESDRVVGLDAGADDYITKPFSPRELAARVRAVMRRGRPEEAGPPPIYRGEHLVADFDAVSISVDGEQIRLTRREFELLKYLAQHAGQVRTRSQLLHAIWGYDFFGDTRTIDVHVRRLRAKLGTGHQQMITTVRNVGYKLVRPA